jgi:protein TonB
VESDPDVAIGAAGTPDARTSAVAFAVALTVHALVAVGIARVDGRWSRTVDAPVEIEVNEPSPPPPEVRPDPVLPPEPLLPIAPRIVRKLTPDKTPRPAPEHPTPPPPNQQPPPEAPRNAPPVFGVTMSSVVSGEAAMAVPVGNTTTTKDRSRAAKAPQPYTGGAPYPPAPVLEIDLMALPRKLHEVNSAEIYPPEARTLGIEGTVRLSVQLDEKGSVVGVSIIKRAGHDFDEAAASALRRFRFSPALARDGRAVPYRLVYDFKFTIGD